MSFLVTFLTVFVAILIGLGLIHCLVKVLEFVEHKFDLKFLIPIICAAWVALMITLVLFVMSEAKQNIKKLETENKSEICLKNKE